MSQVRAVILVVALVMTAGLPAQSQKGQRRPLAAADVDAITQLVMLEDTRQFDEAVLTKLLKSAHPEVRRRAVVATGRIVNPAGRALLASARKDDDADIVATVAFATGQLKDADAVPWLSELLMARARPQRSDVRRRRRSARFGRRRPARRSRSI